MARTSKICGEPSCGNIQPCPDHPKGFFGKRSGSRDPFYSSAAWRRVSKAFLADHPRCEGLQGRPCGRPSAHADHEPERRVLLELGEDPLSREFLHALCVNCHSSKSLSQTNRRRNAERRLRAEQKAS